MALAAGTRLGPYEVAAQIGKGGMGEVYQATDTKLKRQVAIKVLPESVAADADRLARFQREAEVLASLNHPHIAAIYGLEDADGVKALVMELVEGPTLADRIAQGPAVWCGREDGFERSRLADLVVLSGCRAFGWREHARMRSVRRSLQPRSLVLHTPPGSRMVAQVNRESSRT